MIKMLNFYTNKSYNFVLTIKVLVKWLFVSAFTLAAVILLLIPLSFFWTLLDFKYILNLEVVNLVKLLRHTFLVFIAGPDILKDLFNIINKYLSEDFMVKLYLCVNDVIKYLLLLPLYPLQYVYYEWKGYNIYDIYTIYDVIEPKGSVHITLFDLFIKCYVWRLEWTVESYDVTFSRAVNFWGTQVSNAWVTSLILYVTVSVIYFLNKKLYEYNTVYIIMSVLLVLQLITSLALFYLNLSFHTGLQTLLNSSMLIWAPFNIYVDNLSAVFLLTVYMISLGVGTYQWFYIEDSYHKNRFFIQIHWFVTSMVMVILSSNWILLLFSWEMLGQTSFFLIGFFKIKISPMKSSLKAFFYNRISDLVLLLAFVVNTKLTSSFNIAISEELKLGFLLVGFLITVTALIKSAQFFFFFWLPDSMEAPIPASALIHSATLVSAGFYLILRHITYIESSKITISVLFLTSSVSMIIFSLIASAQTDVKKLLAYSTISNCAFIYFLISLNLYNLAILYFTTHGLLKSFAFMVGGILIRDLNHYQDSRNWSISNSVFNKLTLLLSIVILMLSAVPFTTSYDIKSAISNLNFSSNLQENIFKLVLIFYTLNSYNYGMKIPTLLFTKNYNYSKNIINFNYYKNYEPLTYIFNLYFVFVVTLFISYNHLYFDFYNLQQSLTFVIAFLIINIFVIKLKINIDLNYINLLFLVIISMFYML